MCVYEIEFYDGNDGEPLHNSVMVCPTLEIARKALRMISEKMEQRGYGVKFVGTEDRLAISFDEKDITNWCCWKCEFGIIERHVAESEEEIYDAIIDWDRPTWHCY